MSSRFDDADHQLRWPRALFAREASKLLNDRGRAGWNDACELLIEDAFADGVDSGPLNDFSEVVNSSFDDDPWGSKPAGGLTAKQDYLRRLMQNADRLRENLAHRKPYWSQRKSGASAQPLRRTATARQFSALISELDGRGYFEKRFGKDCVDDPAELDPSDVIEREIGVSGLWPIDPVRLGEDLDLFCDVVEVLHDLVARPEARSPHSYGGCGWHHSRFAGETGRQVYRWRVNQLLTHSDLALQLADDGEDVGRMTSVTADERATLVDAMVARDDEVGDQIRHAVALFRHRDAGKHEKRSAVVVLCNVLEERRKLIKAELLSKDEDALFMIANRFSVRHQSESQQSDYDPVFLDWLFWWYLGTIELTDRLAARGGPSSIPIT